jgi:hypothetical protein
MILCTRISYRMYKKKYVERSEIVKYSKQRQNGDNFEHVHCMSVCWARKKFELKDVKFFLKTSPWVWRIHSPKSVGSRRRWFLYRGYLFAESQVGHPLGEFDRRGLAVTTLRWRRQLGSSLSALATVLSANNTSTVGRPFAKSWSPEALGEGSLCRGQYHALGEELLCREPGFWLSAKLPTLGEGPVSGSEC